MKFKRSHEVMYIETLWSDNDRSTASKIEAALKKLPRSRKDELIAGAGLAEVFGGETAEKYSRVPAAEYDDVLSGKK